MSGRHVVYDALAMPVLDSWMMILVMAGAVMCTVTAIRGWMQLRRKLPDRSDEDLTIKMVGRVIVTLMATSAVGFLVYAGAQTAFWRYEYTHHQYAILDGCVVQFEETVQSDHDLGVDHFMLQGHSFTLSDSGWRMGFHLSHHHGSPIEGGAHLRVFAQGPHLLRIELLATPCSGSGQFNRRESAVRFRCLKSNNG